VADLEGFTTRPLRNGGLRSTSARQLDITALRGWFSWLHQRGHVGTNPAAELEPPRAKRRLARPIPDEHWLALWDATTSDELRVALALGYFLGLRPEEMTLLCGSQVTPELLTAFVRKGGSEHTLPWRELVELHAQHRTLSRLVPADVAELYEQFPLLGTGPVPAQRAEKSLAWHQASKAHGSCLLVLDDTVIRLRRTSCEQ
jgi:site-specific recombinase XerC